MAKYISGRQKNLKVGISSYSENLTSLEVIGKVGVGTTNAGGRNLYVIGDAEVTGILTTNSYYIGTNQVISSARQLQNIASLDATTTATIESAIVNAPNTFIDLQVTGISTFVNGPVAIGTVGSGTSTGTALQRLQVSGGAYVRDNVGVGTTNPTSKLHVIGDVLIVGVTTLGVTTTTNLISQTLNVSGISTLGITSATNLTSQQLNVSGITTLGITSTTNLTSQQLNVSGITTLGVTILSQLNVSGISTLQSTTLIGGGTSTGTVGQPLQVSGGAYVSGNLGIGTTNPQAQLHITGQFQSTQANSTTTGGGQIYLNGATGNRIDFNTNGVAAPAFTTRSAGTKLVLYPSVGASLVDYAFGIESATLWSSIPDSTYQFKWYAGTTNIVTLFGTGELGINTTTKTGTSSQPLQVSGGAYIGGNLGVGNTNGEGIKLFVSQGAPAANRPVALITDDGTIPTMTSGATLRISNDGNINSFALLEAESSVGKLIFTNAGNLGIGTTNPTSKLHVVGDTYISGITTVGFITATNLNVSGVGTFLSSGLKIRNPANTFGYTITGSAIVADRILNLPVITATDTVATLGLAQTFSATQTFSGNLILSSGNFSHTGTTQSFTANSYTTGAVTIGGPLQVGAITVGQATTSQTLNLATGVSGIGTTKTINVGTAGATGSLTQINIGPTAGVGTITVNSGTNLGIGSLTPISKLDVVGDARFTGVVTATTFSGNATSASYANVAGVSTALQIPRNFSITGNFVTATAVSFDGTGNVALAATIPLDAIGLGTYTSGDYVKNITGTANQITVTSGSGEGSAPVLSLPTSIVFPQDVTVTRDLQVTRNLSVTGTISIGGTSAFVNVQQLRVTDADLILGVRTDITGNDSSNDTTANTGGIAVASTEGSPLVSLYSVAIGETASPTYKKIMWFKTGSFSGLGTDAWLINYAVGIGSTQFPTGTRLAAGSVQFTERDLAVVRNINASGVVTTTTLDVGGNVKISGISTLGITTATNLTSQQLNVSGITTLGITSTTNLTSQQLNVSGITTLGVTSTTNLTSQQLNVSGISTLQSTTLIGTGTSTGTAGQVLQVTGINSSVYIGGSVGIGSTNPASKLTVAGQIQSIGAGSTLTGGGQIFLNGVTSNRIDFNSNGIAPPTFTTRSAGSKLVLYPSVGGSTVDYAFGIEPTTLWSSIPDSTYQFKWYAGTTNIATLFGTGELVLGSTNITGTASQPLQVTGGAAFYGTGASVGIGTTIAPYTLSITNNSTTSTVGLANALADFTSSVNLYSQINIRNALSGTNASSDVVVTADTGTDSTNFLDMGINNSGFSTSTWTVNGATDGYLYTSNTNLSIGVATTGKYLSFFVGGTLISNEQMRVTTSGVGIGTTNPTSALTVWGDASVSGVITAITFSGALTGTASSIKGGAGGSIPYQTAADTTTFLANGTGGFILQSNGGTSAPSWVPAAPAGAVTGLVVRDLNNTIVGTSGSISQLTFSTGFSVTGTTGAAGIATITIADNINFVGTGISISGISTFDGVKISSGIVTSTNPGVTTVVYYGDGSKLSNIITGVSISTNTTNQSQYIPYVSGTGSTTGFGVTTTGLVFNPSSNNLGIGTASPAFKADIAGDARVTSTNKMRFGGTAGTSNFYIQYNSTTNSLDFVAG